MRRRNKRMRIAVIIIVIIVVAALVFTYVMMFPTNAFAAEPPPTPPPDDYGTSGDYDDTTLPPFPGEEEEVEPLEPTLVITSGPIRIDVGQSFVIPYVMNDFPAGTLMEWESKNPNVAVVSSDGILYAVSPGDVEIAVRAGAKRSSVLVTVNELRANRLIIVVDPDIIQTGSSSYQMTVGDVTKFAAKIEPEGAKVDKITWVLGNGNVASLAQNGDFIAEAIGQTQVTLTADSLVTSITINIVESGVPLDTIWDYLRYGVIIIIIVVVIVVLLVWMAGRRKKEKARQKAIAAKRRREEAERRARAEASMYDGQRDKREPRAARTEERETMRVSGAAVGAGKAPPEEESTETERPLTLDDLE